MGFATDPPRGGLLDVSDNGQLCAPLYKSKKQLTNQEYTFGERASGETVALKRFK
jgi:hypothetical protein